MIISSRPGPRDPGRLAIGDRLPVTSYTVRRADLVRYAGASGDFNVIHWSDRAARAAGLPDVIAHGMLTMALGGRYLGEWWGDPTAIVDYAVRFARPVVVPDTDEGVQVTFGGEVVAVEPESVRVVLTASGPDGEVLTGATAELAASQSSARVEVEK